MIHRAAFAICLAATAPSATAQEVTFTVLDAPMARTRPVSDVPYIDPDAIAQTRAQAAHNARRSLQDEGRFERRMVLPNGTHTGSAGSEPGLAVGTRALSLQLGVGTRVELSKTMGVAGAFTGRRRALYRQLERVAAEAEAASRAAEKAYADWAAGSGSHREMLSRETMRQVAVRDLIALSDKVEQQLAADDELMAAAVATSTWPQGAIPATEGVVRPQIITDQ